MGGHIRLVSLGALLVACSSGGLTDLQARLEAEPLRFGRVAVGTEVVQDLVVKNRGRASVSLLGIERGEGLSEVFSIEGDPIQLIRGGRSGRIEIRFRPSEVMRYEGSLYLITDDEEFPRIQVPLEGVGDRPSVACSAELAFGRVVLNTEKVLPVTCINGGRVSAEIGLGAIEGEDPQLFSLVDSRASLPVAPGETVDVEVRFFAGRLGKASALLPITIIGAEDPEQEVELSAEGYASSLVAAPNCLHFGPVSPGQVATSRVIVANGGDSTVNFDGPALVDGSGVFAIASIRVNGRAGDLERLAPQEQAEIEVEFAPSSIGRFSGALELRNDDPVGSHLEVCLSGIGGGADIAAEPDPLDFGTVALGMEVKKKVWVRNAGTLDGGPLEIFGATVSGDGFGLQGNITRSLSPSDGPAPVEVSFRAEREGTFTGTLLLESNDGDQPILPITLLGSARDLPPCEWRADPPTLSFVPIQLRSQAQLVTRLVNLGDDDCVFASPRFSDGTPDAFSLPSDTPSVALVPPGEGLLLAVLFDARRVGRLKGELLFDVSNPATPQGSVALEAETIDGCLRFEPPVADFGLRRESCPAALMEVELINRCPGGISVHTSELDGSGSEPGEIQVIAPEPPFHMVRNSSARFLVSYDPLDEGSDGALLKLTSTMHPVSLPIFGQGTMVDERTDAYRQKARAPVDILFVIDNSGSMSDKQRSVAEGCEKFMSYAIQQGIDFHIGVTTTGIARSVGGWIDCPGGAYGGEAGRLFPVNRQRPRWVTSNMPDAAAVFAENVQVGTCHWLEQGLEAAFRALTKPLVDSQDHPNTSAPMDGNLGFYRPEARLSVVIISDEDDQSDRTLSFYKSFFRGLKGPGREHDVSVNAVVGRDCKYAAEEGLRYIEVAEATGGMVEPICTNDWGEALGRLAEQSFGYTLSFPLSAKPEGEIVVRVDGVEQSYGWAYDPIFNAVVFTEEDAPAPGALVELTYVPAC